eukprot:3885079-Rhodomonas_salina.4
MSGTDTETRVQVESLLEREERDPSLVMVSRALSPYAVSGTDIAYATMRGTGLRMPLPVLTERMLVPVLTERVLVPGD